MNATDARRRENDRLRPFAIEEFAHSRLFGQIQVSWAFAATDFGSPAAQSAHHGGPDQDRGAPRHIPASLESSGMRFTRDGYRSYSPLC
jgi:hypothetical protein